MLELTQKDKLFIYEHPHLEDAYLRSREKGTGENLAQMLTLQDAPGMKIGNNVKGGTMISSQEMAQEKKLGFKREKERRDATKKRDSFSEFLEKTGRSDIFKDIKE